MDYYQRNLELLRKQQTRLAKTVEAFNDSSHNFQVLPTKKNSFTVKRSTKENSQVLHSIYDPEKEASRIVNGYKISKHSNVVLLGFGFGYHAKKLYLKFKDECDFILVIEKDIALFKLALKYVDLADILGQKNFFLAVDEEAMTIFRFLQGMSIQIISNGLTIVKHEPSYKSDIDYYKKVIEKLKDVVVWGRVNIISQVKTTDTYYKNIFSNIPEFLTTPGVDRFFNKFKDIPAVIVSAGPSLTKNIEYLKKISENFLIIAVDTALKVLLSYQISPHLVVSIDFTPDNLKYFKGLEVGDTYLVVDPEVYPQIFKDYPGPKLVMNLINKSLCSWMQTLGVQKGILPKGLSVAHTSFTLAREFGCSPIIFLGQDLAFSSGITHARSSVMSRKVNVEKIDEGTVLVSDIFGKEVATSTSMQVFLKHFEEMLFDLKEESIDATEGGARIAGTRLMPLREVLYKYKSKGAGNVRERMESIVAKEEDIDIKKFLKEVKKTVLSLNTLHQACTKGLDLIDQILKEIEAKSINKNRLKNLCEQWGTISKTVYAKKDVLAILRDNITDVLVLQAKRMYNISDIEDIQHEAKKNEIITALKRDRLFYGRLETSGKFVSSQFIELEENLLKIIKK
ncbi:motility associated factor glycosyltransferase family protein [Candidatus Auribacterota bacterium]